MTPSEACVDMVKHFEGFRALAYRDCVGVLTIGYGTTIGVKEGDVMSVFEATDALREDLADAGEAVSRLVDVALTENQNDALCSFVYNLGAGALATSTLLKLLNYGDYSGAAAQFLRWDHAGGKVLPGLTKRRQAEKALFLS